MEQKHVKTYVRGLIDNIGTGKFNDVTPASDRIVLCIEKDLIDSTTLVGEWNKLDETCRKEIRSIWREIIIQSLALDEHVETDRSELESIGPNPLINEIT